ncbi:GH23428 [Drosophila grimshawi]|uniref:GH23428 n=1 Tax=Drosophila grimshawi TaxID=7222 RepID=B4K145_DROGR|nr:GH23428 [Drosophila grimshawi]
MSKQDYKPVLTRTNRFELFSIDECEQILKAVLKDQNQMGILNKFQILPAIEHVGFLGEYYHLVLSYRLENETEERTTRLFVKSMVYENADMSYYDEKSGIIKKEAKLYELLLNELKKFSAHVWCAKCYFTRDDLFVMQNIEDLGYRSLPSETKFLSEEQLRPMLRALATLHASSVAYERKHRVTIGVEFRQWLLEKSIDPDIEWWTTGIKAILAVTATHPRVINDAAAQAYIANELPRCLDRVYYMANPSPVHRNVFLHRDAWGGNVFYPKEQSENVGCVLVDFQLCRYAPPAVDFLMASYLNVEPAQRKEMMERITSDYYEHLVSELVAMGVDAEREQLSRSDFEQSLKDFSLFGATYNCIAATILRLPDNYLKKLKDEQAGEFHSFCNVDRTKSVLSLMDEHEDFRCYLYACVDDLLELTYYKQAE